MLSKDTDQLLRLISVHLTYSSETDNVYINRLRELTR